MGLATVFNAISGFFAYQSGFSFRIGGIPEGTFSVLGFTGEHHALSADYRFTVELVAPSCVDPAGVIGKPAVLELSPGKSPIHGVVASFASAGEVPDGRHHVVEIASPLHPLSLGRSNRVFIGRSAPQILEEVARGAGLQVRSVLKESYPVREFTAQFDESDFDFLQRLAATWGIFYRFEQGEDGATLLFHDTLEDLPRKATPLLYREESGAVRPDGTVFSLRARAQLLPQSVELRDYNYRTPETALHASATPVSGAPGFGLESRYWENAKDLSEAQRLARLRQQALDGGRQLCLAETDCRDLAPGEHITIVSHPELDGSYLILGIEHRGDQRSAFAYGDEVKGPTFRNTLHLIRAGVPWRPPLPENRRHHGTFTARIESPGGDYAHLDEQGRYRLRLDFDGGGASAAGASHPVRMAQPYGGRDHGLHFPLYAGTEVVVTCLGGELDRPVILGALPNPDTPTTVGAGNHSQNILRTRGGNELLMDDRKGQEKVELFTAGRRNILTLDGDAQGHTVRLASEEGKMEVSAARTALLSSGQTQTLRSGADHLVTVEKAQCLVTNQGEIAQQAATDIRMQAGAHILTQVEAQEVTLTTARDLNAEAGRSLSVAVRQNDLGLLTGEGRIAFQAAEKIIILGQGGGPIHLGQGGGAIEISTKGTVSFQSQRITISAGKITVRSGAASNNSGAYGAGKSAPKAAAKTESAVAAKPGAAAGATGTKAAAKREEARKILVRKISGPSEGRVGETLTYTVTQFNIPDPTAEERRRVNWIVKCEGKVIDKFEGCGETLQYKAKETPNRASVEVYAYISSPSEQVKQITSFDCQIIFGNVVSPEFKKKVIRVASNLGIDPNYLMAAMAFETGETFSPTVKNASGSGAIGLIQFTSIAINDLSKNTGFVSKDMLLKMSNVEQMDYVESYFRLWAKRKGAIVTLEDVYMAILCPDAIGKSLNFPLYSRGEGKKYTQNAGLDGVITKNPDGVITKEEASFAVRKKYEKGRKFMG